MLNGLLIFLGSGLGGLTRYGVANGAYWLLGRQFPYGTFVVNATGSLIMGFLFALILERFNEIGVPLRAFLLIGFLGGYTTFSSFSIETVNLIENGEWLNASLNVLLNVVLCISLCWLGAVGGRHL